MRIDIEQLLKENSAVNDYRINRTVTESYELFFVHRTLETVRATDTESVNVTVYVDHDGKKGNASFRIYASTEEEEARAKIADAVKKAALVGNEYYEIPANETLEGKIASNFEEYTPRALAAKIADAVFSADTLENGSINALEVFVNKLTVSVKNSRGIDKTEVKYSAMLEAIPTWNEGESVELYEAKRFSSLDMDDIREEISRRMREVRDRGKATPPTEKLSCPVLLQTQELAELIASLAGDLGYGSVYAHANPFSEGDALQKNATGDGITLTMRGALEGCVASALFDDDGTTLVDTEIIKDGVVTSYYGSSRFAQYLGKPVTGALSCMDVSLGSLSEEELKKAPYFACASMSGLQVDVYNDYIGGEVRLAYYFDGEKTIPMTGVSISGKLSDALASIRLANVASTTGRYRGPAFALFGGIEIV